MTCYRNGVKYLILLCFMGLAVLNTYSYWRDSRNRNTDGTSMQPDVIVEQRPSSTPFQCPFESWNQVHSDTVTNENLHLEWIQNNISRRDNILESQIRLLSSFVYPDHISITTNSQRSYGQKVYCRYYNCLREEISNSSYQSIFFPMNVIRCPRRIGVKYMSISFDSEEIPQEPIPLVYRVFEAPIHEVSVCVGPIYGSESKWLEIAEFIEHYNLIGVRYFYFTVFNMNEYSRKIIDEYLRTGEIELTVIQSEYKTIDWQFHLLQINECHQRSKHHSKWVINVDIDERLVILDDKIKSVGSLLSGYNNTVAEVGFAIRRIQKTEKLPEKYESDEQIISEMEFLKYNVSSPVTWGAYKTIYRPEKIAAMYYHWAYQRYPDTVAEYVTSEVALLRHYRSTEKNILGSGWLTDPNYKNFSVVPEETEFAEKLKENVLKKIKYVYDQRVLYCEEIAEIPYEEYKEFGHDIFNCTFRNETVAHLVNRKCLEFHVDRTTRRQVSIQSLRSLLMGRRMRDSTSFIEGNTKDLSVESSAVVIVPRTTVAPGDTNKVSVIPFRPLHFTAPPKNGPPGVSPPPAPGGQCGVAPDFTPCVSNEIASKSLLECCKRKNLPAGCQQLCRYDITQAEIRAAMDRGECGIFNVAPFLECASQGKDSSECCRHRGIVQKTGPQCEQFCRPTQGLSALGVQHIVCGNAVGDMLHCHHSGVRV
ncbi:hypothetical protein CRE_21469 [Caenorhabditis remanei]|uniref:Domain of unknown function DB domain-containing protein n=1 Tax=Caenorhabditis remanei TaxID=31234 RepID=E3N3Q3_CAERE|nr:hypothetical protein CRE_21469 [Caenorhabditis remanei]